MVLTQSLVLKNEKQKPTMAISVWLTQTTQINEKTQKMTLR
jgi:hypothetical protein